MKNSQKQNVIININSEIKRTKKKRVYKKNNNDLAEQQNPQNTAYNPSSLVKSNIAPSYGLKSINPIMLGDNSGMMSLLLDKIRQPEPNKEQYMEHFNTPIKKEPSTQIKPEAFTPVKEERFTPQKLAEHFQSPLLRNIPEEPSTPKKNNISEFRINKPNFSIYQTPEKLIPDKHVDTDFVNTEDINVVDKYSPHNLKLLGHNYLKPGRHPLDKYEKKSQIKGRIRYLNELIKKHPLLQSTFETEKEILEKRLVKGDYILG